MITTIRRLLVPLFIAIVTVAITYYVNRAAPDVRYSLSEKIPVTFANPTNATPETVQQLEIKNIGNAPAHKIVVKIDGQLTAYSIEKYSTADNVKVFDHQLPFEIVYPELPPQAGFRIIFTSPGDGIDYANLDISHDSGVAHEALSKTSSLNNIAIWMYLGGFFVYMFLSGKSIRESSISLWKVRASISNPKQILQMKRPWYAFESEWPQLQVDILKEKLTKNYIGRGQPIQKSAAYQLLAVSTFEQIESFEHKEIIELAIEILEKAIMLAINSAYSASEIIGLLRVNRPEQFPSGRWNDLEERGNKQYVALRKHETIYHNSDADKKLKETKPDEIAQPVWSELISYWTSQYGEYLRKDYFGRGQTIQKSAAYQLLAVGTPEQTESFEHNEILELAIEILEKAILSAINSAYNTSEIIELLRVNRPVQFPSGKWNDLVERGNKQYVALRKNETSYRNRDADKKLKETKPDEIAQPAWSEIISYWTSQYGEYLLTELITNNKPLEFAQNIDINVLDESRKFAWQRHVSQLQDVEKYQEMSGLLNKLLKNEIISETKPVLFTDWEWMKFKDFETLLKKLRDLEILEKQNETAELQISRDKISVSRLKEKLERQLQFIHELLNDPTIIDRVEEYDDTFAAGNWANLQKVAQLLSGPKR